MSEGLEISRIASRARWLQKAWHSGMHASLDPLRSHRPRHRTRSRYGRGPYTSDGTGAGTRRLRACVAVASGRSSPRAGRPASPLLPRRARGDLFDGLSGAEDRLAAPPRGEATGGTGMWPRGLSVGLGTVAQAVTALDRRSHPKARKTSQPMRLAEAVRHGKKYGNWCADKMPRLPRHAVIGLARRGEMSA